VISRLNVQNLWMHVPDYHAKNMMDFFHDPRWTLDGLTTGLRRAYGHARHRYREGNSKLPNRPAGKCDPTSAHR
jgi:hypothetical protein